MIIRKTIKIAKAMKTICCHDRRVLGSFTLGAGPFFFFCAIKTSFPKNQPADGDMVLISNQDFKRAW